MADRDITHLCPELQELLIRFTNACKTAGLTVRPTVTWRSPDDQNKCKAEGLSNAAAGASPHDCVAPDGSPYSKAFDFGIFEEDGTYVTDGEDSRYAQAGSIGKDLGLAWGGDWPHPDWDHLELKNWKNV